MSKVYDDRFKLSSKLYQLFETYLKYLFLGGNIFSYSPSLKLPKVNYMGASISVSQKLVTVIIAVVIKLMMKLSETCSNLFLL